ncbi:hypothetical protein EG329_012406 [Mollisiaceae sp. DMI_Dod_QoI]|nr:hypothetical protein EG329_012406 [Helotiales sp. DMI_Dod_QoI]
MATASQTTGLPTMTASLLDSGMWSDLQIKCRERLWKVHRVVVCLQSKPLSAAINGNFKEAQTGVIDLSDHEPGIVNHMIQFMYEGDYKVEHPEVEVKEEGVTETRVIADEATATAAAELLAHTAVYLLAEEKDIPALKILATKKYTSALPLGWNSGNFCTTLKEIYENTPENDRMLWEVAIAFAGSKAKELMDRGENRRIKCDEQKPHCDKCTKSGFSCDGYQVPRPLNAKQKAHLRSLTPDRPIIPEPAPKSSLLKPIPTLNQWNASGASLLLQPRNTLFRTEQESRYFRLFCDEVAVLLSGVFDLPLWNRLIFQTAEQEESVRHGIVSIGALQKIVDSRKEQGDRYPAPSAAVDDHHRFAIQQYSKAIKQMRDAISSQKHSLRNTLLTCLLIICFESLHGNHESAMAQMQIGISLLEDFISSRRNSLHHSIQNQTQNSNIIPDWILPDNPEATTLPSFALESPAPDIIEDDLLHAFGRLDIQANSFIESRPIHYHMEMKNYGSDCISHMPATFSSVHEARRYYELVMRRLMHWISSVYHRRGQDDTQAKGNQLLHQLSPLNPEHHNGAY